MRGYHVLRFALWSVVYGASVAVGVFGVAFAGHAAQGALARRAGRLRALEADEQFRGQLAALLVADEETKAMAPDERAYVELMFAALGWWTDEHPGAPSPRLPWLPHDAPDRDQILLAYTLEHDPARLGDVLQLLATTSPKKGQLPC
jgi:hypothetical protein